MLYKENRLAGRSRVGLASSIIGKQFGKEVALVIYYTIDRCQHITVWSQLKDRQIWTPQESIDEQTY